ncbi:SURF1 family protein [Pseudothauera rhizosphaerae]|uniref:SURF1-like protein n=1 Tax=Pseudothauera rhizosphaerae TaxID=2565932 RepID=A0A4S4AB73_9RHOO|nr:SURF1 family protein [Pseudothauera rhizosphaerae]THF56198.1 SURF1 family protein [Pseudothauera rhizosphaerae]
MAGLPDRFRQCSVAAAPLLAGLLVVVVTVQLGNWQLRRAAEKTALQQTIAERSAQPPAVLGTSQPAEWAPLQLHGQWHPQHLFYLDNRIHQGRAGYHVFAPFLDAASGRWVMVARGWIAADTDRSRLPDVAIAPDSVAVTGQVRLPGESYTLADTETDGRRWQTVALPAWRATTGLPLENFTLQQTSPAPDALVRDWPRPDAGIDRHRGYALQWFAMATLAAALTAWQAWRLTRRTTHEQHRVR